MADAELTDAHHRILAELTALTEGTEIQIAGSVNQNGTLVVALDLDTRTFTQVDGGLPVFDKEPIYVFISSSFPWVPPRVEVDHNRWEDQPHVLQGWRLCLYLDPATEWNPTAGIAGFLERLWDWFDDAIANRFDPATALYHPVGGVLHRTEGTPTVVASTPIAHTPGTFAVRGVTLRNRADSRIDVVSWDRRAPAPGDYRGVLVVLPGSLPRGGGTYLSDAAITIRKQTSRHQRKQLLSEIEHAAGSLTSEQFLHVVFAVPNEHLVGDARLHLVGWRLARPLVPAAVDAARRRHGTDAPHDNEPAVEWTYVDDLRPAVTTRRDTDRPVSTFAGKTIELWGCGALGSWIAELLVRAGVRHLVLRDTGYVTRGLLVRQNYREADVGKQKVDALAERLRAISDTVVVDPLVSFGEAGLPPRGDVDTIFDTTVNTSVTVAISEAQASGECPIPVVQVATDNATATLGILTVTRGDQSHETGDLDHALMALARSEPALDPFTAFWRADNDASFTPTLGCSVPTFHGSGADAAVVAASAVSLAGMAIQRRVSGGYLFAAPHTPYAVPAMTHVPSP